MSVTDQDLWLEVWTDALINLPNETAATPELLKERMNMFADKMASQLKACGGCTLEPGPTTSTVAVSIAATAAAADTTEHDHTKCHTKEEQAYGFKLMIIAELRQIWGREVASIVLRAIELKLELFLHTNSQFGTGQKPFAFTPDPHVSSLLLDPICRCIVQA